MDTESGDAAPLAANGTTTAEAAPLAEGGGDVPDSDGYFSSYENFEVSVRRVASCICAGRRRPRHGVLRRSKFPRNERRSCCR